MVATKETSEIAEPIERVFTPDELGKQAKLHPATVRKLFRDEPGVIRIGHGSSDSCRQHFTLRIPQSVVERVFARMTVRGAAR